MRWFLSPSAAILYCFANQYLSETLDAATPGASVVTVFNMLLFQSVMGTWVMADARQRQIQLPFDFGFLASVAWPVVIPIYLFRTRHWQAFKTIGWFALLNLAGYALAWIPYAICALPLHQN